ncbi:MAG TPA: capsular biosynthesis protein [Clostridiales bacterium]|nr:capsular biosynthesis protein [Clostridiales bacterium]
MIDFHTHILPNVDDGSKSVEETFDLIKEAESVGFDSIISTSHYIENYYESPVEERQEWINALSMALKKENINVNLYLGNEVYFSENIIKLLNENKIAKINNSKYMLFEFAMNVKPINVYDVIYELLQNKITPILAHPERYRFVHQDPSIIYDLIDNGVLMQANYSSIIGWYGQKAEILVKKFLESDMISFLGSDVHRPNTIYPKIPEILERIEEIIGKDRLFELTTLNPTKVLQNEEIELLEPKEFKYSFKEKLIMNSKK